MKVLIRECVFGFFRERRLEEMREITEKPESILGQKTIGGLRTEQSRILRAIALSRFRTLDLYRFLSTFAAKKKRKELKTLRREFGETVSYEERLSDEIPKMREDRF